jgi:hypothetical protein
MPDGRAGTRARTCKSAALQVLRGADEPLHCLPMAQMTAARGPLTSSGRLSDQKMAAQLYTDVSSCGDASLIVQVRWRTFGLRGRDQLRSPAGQASALAAYYERSEPLCASYTSQPIPRIGAAPGMYSRPLCSNVSGPASQCRRASD